MSAPITTTPASLLIVDDDPVFAAFVQQLLLTLNSEFPCTQERVDSAEKAMAELGRNAFDLVLLDYHLPGADGLQVLARIREMPDAQQPAVIMLTGSGNESVAVAAMKGGAKDYLPKDSLDLAPLLRALNSALSQKRLADQVAGYNAQMRADLDMARQFQLSLLPDHYPAFPHAASPEESALRFNHRFIPAAELAGDFFSVHALSDSRAGIFICDVMGHGVRSALVTAMMRALVDNEVSRTDDPAAFLTEMNRRFSQLIRPEDGPMFATAFYMIADVATGRLRYAAAGHPRPLHVRRGAGVVAPLEMPRNAGPALGMIPGASYVGCECAITAGDAVLLFTDGLFEVAGAGGVEEFGRQRLLAAAQENVKLPVPELCDALIAGVRKFSGSVEFGDDVCLLAMEAVRVG